MPEQLPELVIDDPAAARSLMNVAFLSRFLEPASPSDVARRLGMPANLAHHHARRALKAGVLFEARRDQGKVLYQLSARQFKVPGELREGVGAGERVFHRLVTWLTTAFLRAFDRSESAAQGREGRWSVVTFTATDDTRPVAPVNPHSDESRPAFFVQRTFSMTPAGYRRLLSRIQLLIEEEHAHPGDPRAAVCTVAALGFEGLVYQELSEDSLSTTAFFDTAPEALR